LKLLGAALALAIGCVPWAAEPGALPGQQQAQSSSVPEGAVTAGSGIYGYTVAEWGNPPANPPTTQCLKVFDSSAITPCHRRLLWHMGELSVPLAPGRYVVETGGSWQSKNGAVTFVPERKIVEVG